MLTPSQKLKRNVSVQRFREKIDNETALRLKSVTQDNHTSNHKQFLSDQDMKIIDERLAVNNEELVSMS